MSSSSGYKGHHWKRPQDRGGGGGVPKPQRVAGATQGQDETETPFLTDVSAQNMERYIEAVHQYTLSSHEHAKLAPWIRGSIPLVMLEHELPRTRERLTGLAAKHNIQKDGTVSTQNLTAMEVRMNLIIKTMSQDMDRRAQNKQNSLGDPKGEIGSSSMDAESSSKDKRTVPSVRSRKDLSTKTGSSSMDASRSARDPETERADQSEEEESDYED